MMRRNILDKEELEMSCFNNEAQQRYVHEVQGSVQRAKIPEDPS